MPAQGIGAALGLDIGGHGVKAARLSADGEVLAQQVAPIGDASGRSIEAVEALVAGLVADLDPSGALPVGVGVPGFHDRTTGLLRQSPNFPGWEDQPVGERLADVLGRPVRTENDANCALLGEAWSGAARGVRDVVMLTLGTGVGSAFLVGGTLLTGARGAGAEAGHLTIHPGGRPCGCGRRGCLEAYASGPALLVTAREEGGEALSASPVFAASRAGEPWAVAAVERYCSDLADGLVALIHVFSPGAIVLGGGVSGGFDTFARRVEELVEERAIPACLAGVLPLRRAALGANGGAVGAASLFLGGEAR